MRRARGASELAGRALALERARRGRLNPLVVWITRAVLRRGFAVRFRTESTGCEHIPPEGPVILAANHRSVLDPIVLGLLVRRPVYYMAKQELFRNRRWAWLLSALGGFPVSRGGADVEAIAVARRVLERGDCLVIFPEGKCVSAGPPGSPRRGVGRLALATGAPVVPISIIGTELGDRRRLPPGPIHVDVARPISFSPFGAWTGRDAARRATDRIWAAVTATWQARAVGHADYEGPDCLAA